MSFYLNCVSEEVAKALQKERRFLDVGDEKRGKERIGILEMVVRSKREQNQSRNHHGVLKYYNKLNLKQQMEHFLA